MRLFPGTGPGDWEGVDALTVRDVFADEKGRKDGSGGPEKGGKAYAPPRSFLP